MHLKSDNIEVMIYEIFESHLSKNQIGIERSMKENNFIFDLVQLLY